MSCIKISSAKIAIEKEANGVGFDGPSDREQYRQWDACGLYGEINAVVAYDACTVVARPEDADELAAELAARGIDYTGRRQVYFCDGPEGFVIHTIHAG